MHPTMHDAFFGVIFLATSPIVVSMCAAGIGLGLIGILAAKNNIAQARGLDKIVALGNLCFAAPLAVFGAEHFADAKDIMQIVPRYMPWHLFWTYFVGAALIATSLSVATKIRVQWSGLLFGLMMFAFNAMLTVPAVWGNPHNRFGWALLFREPSFGGGGWILAASALAGWHAEGRSWLITVGRLLIAVAAIFYGVEHFLHPLGMPGIPLEKEMPAWIPGRAVIDYLTGVILLVCGAGILVAKKTRMAATCLGSWIVLMVVIVYGPVLIAALLNPSTGVRVEGLNYFFDTLLFGGAILALASATPQSD
ncbi:MAG TPA: hypothetical protein VEU96_01430 [Bryobacteraceae bacterium]|nr:hypothetical protein [Bryobacteraceae bacterium]